MERVVWDMAKVNALLSAAVTCGGATQIKKILEQLGIPESEVQRKLHELDVDGKRTKGGDKPNKKKRRRSEEKTKKPSNVRRKKLDI